MPGRRSCLVPEMRKALENQCFSIRPPRFELGTLGLEIPCSIHLSYGREGGFCVSGPPLLDDLLGAGPGNPILYHGWRGGAASPIERIPARIGGPLRVGPHVVAECCFNRLVPHQFLQLGWHDPGRPTLPKGPPEVRTGGSGRENTKGSRPVVAPAPLSLKSRRLLHFRPTCDDGLLPSPHRRFPPVPSPTSMARARRRRSTV